MRKDGRTDGETGMTEAIDAFRNSANAPKKKHETAELSNIMARKGGTNLSIKYVRTETSPLPFQDVMP